MSFVRQTLPGVFVDIPPDAPMIQLSDMTCPANILTTWSLEELAARQIYSVVPFVPPLGQKITGEPSYTIDNNQAVQSYDTVPDTPPVPESITRRQLLLALWQLGIITANEAMAAAQTGTVPASIATAFDQMESNQRTAAYITFAAMSACYRNDPTLALIASIKNISDAQMDDWFRWASTL